MNVLCDVIMITISWYATAPLCSRSARTYLARAPVGLKVEALADNSAAHLSRLRGVRGELREPFKDGLLACPTQLLISQSNGRPRS